jgi:hypothetical protein
VGVIFWDPLKYASLAAIILLARQIDPCVLISIPQFLKHSYLPPTYQLLSLPQYLGFLGLISYIPELNLSFLCGSHTVSE